MLLFVDKKPHIQVLERAQGWRRWPSGKALSGFSLGHRNLFTATAGSSLERAEFEMIITDPAMAFYLEPEEFREAVTAGAALSGRMRWKVVRMVKRARIRERLQPSGIEPGYATA